MKKINLTQDKVTIVDDEDYVYLIQWKWFYHIDKKSGRTGYAYANDRVNNKPISLRMHRLIMQPPIDMEVDHINGNGIDNRKMNLRICSHKDNSRNLRTKKINKSGYRGVFYDNERCKWTAQIKINYKSTFIGRYNSKEDAAIAYDMAAIKHFGDYANTNF